MKHRSIGFIGGGRITRIILQGLARKNRKPGKVVVTDTNPEALAKLAERCPFIKTVHKDVRGPAAADLVFIALPPPAVSSVLDDLKKALNPEAVVVSLSPKLTIGQLSEGLDGFPRIVRMIPNAPSIINKGFNPVAFAPAFSQDEKKRLIRWFQILGDCPEVGEAHLAGFAVITAMGPACLWFQLKELLTLGRSFGMPAKQVERGIRKMMKGMSKTFFEAGMTPEEVMDLIPAKPFSEDEETIKTIYRSKLTGIYKKLKT